MISYNVFFSPKEGVSEDELLKTVHAFLSWLQREQRLPGYRVLRVTDAASFQALPRFQAIIDFPSRAEFDTALTFMRIPAHLNDSPHGRLMHSVKDFKVSFTEDV